MNATTTTQPAQQSPAHPWRRAFVDLTRTHGFEAMRVEGTLPEGLSGTLYRNGPSTFLTHGRPYQHWFDGDGALSAVRFEGGRALGAARFVESAGRQQEQREGRALYGSYGTPPPGGLVSRLRHQSKNAANTSVMVYQGKLYALWEGGKPTELSADDLATLGERDLGLTMTTFSAHPHRVPQRRASYNFGVRVQGPPQLDVFELPDAGAPRKLVTVKLAGATMIHDFIATETHLVFFAPPLRMRLPRLLLGLESYSEALQWKPEAGTEVIVVPIDRPEAVVRFTVDAFYQWHFANAHSRSATELVVDFVKLPDFRSNAWLGQLVREVPDSKWDGTLHRATLDLSARTMRTEQRWDAPCEFPRVGSAVIGKPSRFAYVASYSAPEREYGLFDQLAKVDVDAGTAERVTLGADQYPSEAVFVGKPGAAAEDAGWLLTLVYDAAAHESHVAVMDAERVSDGPVARAYFGHAVPFTFHGFFQRA